MNSHEGFLSAEEAKGALDDAERNLTGSGQLHSQVLGNPVYSWQSPWLMMDLDTGKIPGGTRQNPLKAGFYVPHRYT